MVGREGGGNGGRNEEVGEDRSLRWGECEGGSGKVGWRR